MEIAEYREKAAAMGIPTDIIEDLIDDYLRDSIKGEAVPFEELLEIARETYPDGYVDPMPDPPFPASEE